MSLVGQTFGNLTVTLRGEPDAMGNACASVRCSCGYRFGVRISRLKNGKVTACKKCERDVARLEALPND